MNPTFWRGKSVLVTGHTGFKGSWFCLWLQQLGANVVGVALDPNTEPSLFLEADVARNMTSHLADIRDLDALTRIIRSSSIEIVFHLAAQSLVLPSYRDPLETYSVNVMGTATILEAIRSTNSVQACISVTSDKCYENREWEWPYRESDPLGGHDPYSSSKACAEIVTAAFRSSYFVHPGESGYSAIASARAGNVIGGGDWSAHRLVPDIIRALLSDLAIPLRSPGSVRPWQHVLEPLYGYLMLAEALYERGAAFAQPWNFGPDTTHLRSVAWIAQHLGEAWGRSVVTSDAIPTVHEAAVLALDSSRARHVLAWHPVADMERTLQWTARWYKEHSAGANARSLCSEQIAQYMELQGDH